MSREQVTIWLADAIEQNGEMINELVFQAPTGKDIFLAGAPYSVRRNPRTGGMTENFHFSSARLLLSSMAQVSLSTIDQMQAADLTSALEVLKLFFYQQTAAEILGSLVSWGRWASDMSFVFSLPLDKFGEFTRAAALTAERESR